MPNCLNCHKTFHITDSDQKYYDSLKVPQPTLCPDCRQQRRLTFRNERNLYKRKCDLCAREIISIYSENKKFPVYCADCYWSDKWQAPSLDYKNNQSFFQQFKNLQNKTPRLAIINRNSENSEYTNICEQNKNCYLIIESSNNENCLYCYWIQKSKDLVDCSFCHESELCYECDNCNNCYDLKYCKNCTNCNESMFLENCSGCSNCIGCVNLKNKQYYIFNKLVSKQEYNKYKLNINKFNNFFKKQPRKFAEIYNCENCTGNYILHSKNCQHCFHAHEAENCKYAYHVWRDAKDCMDVDTCGMKAELNYECINTAIDSYNNKFCARCWTTRDTEYSMDCDNSHDLFGCISLNKNNYCILNKKYNQQEYQRLKKQIISDMKNTGEYGEFFPTELSVFDYKESVANEYYPKNKKQINKCNHKFKLISQELKFYQQNNIPEPQICPNCRHQNRMSQRNPQALWKRQCMKPDCNEQYLTSYSPERKELVYCEDCYNREIY